MPSNNNQTLIELDIAVIGGGIAGLWLSRRLIDAGYHCALFEKEALGSIQTLASQGMIHGGVKYTLAGALTGASESIADMPAYWQQCLSGKGDMDLSSAKTLSRHFYFWSSDKASSKVTAFFASKAVRGRVDKVDRDDFPSLLATPEFQGQVYRLQDIVVDVPSVMSALAHPIQSQLFLLPATYEWQRENNEAVLLLHTENHTIKVKAKQFILTAGKGNGEILKTLAIQKPAMQLRPLHQVWVKHNLLHNFFGHCLGADSTPRLSISTHPTADGQKVWSLGGSLAETGVNQSPEDVVLAAKKELASLIPWVDLSNAEYIPVRIDRAEARQRHFLRPDKAFIKSADGIANVMVAWPTKLTLAPNLANEAMQLIKDKGLAKRNGSFAELNTLNTPNVGQPPWDTEPGLK